MLLETLEKISREPFSFRCERKFHQPFFSVAEMRAILLTHPALFREIYWARTINNIYFDHVDQQCFSDHVQGQSCRYKVRIRWYGESDGRIEEPFLEFKIKRGLEGTKVRFLLPGFEWTSGGRFPDFQALFFRSELPDVVREVLLSMRMMLFNRYHRSYYLSADGQFRATVDSRLQEAPLSQQHRIRSAFPYFGTGVILELKYPPGMASRAIGVANAFPFRVDRVSKYVSGLQKVTT